MEQQKQYPDGWTSFGSANVNIQGVKSMTPNQIYYNAVHGRWRCPFRLQIIDWPQFWGSHLAMPDRIALLFLALVPSIVGPPWLVTTVDCKSRFDRNEVVHTTRVSKWGLTLFRSAETINLDGNGRDFTMTMVMRYWPLFWQKRTVEKSRGRVDASGAQADYDFPFLGTSMHQIGRRQGGTTEITQATSFSRGVQLLQRFS